MESPFNRSPLHSACFDVNVEECRLIEPIADQVIALRGCRAQLAVARQLKASSVTTHESWRRPY